MDGIYYNSDYELLAQKTINIDGHEKRLAFLGQLIEDDIYPSYTVQKGTPQYTLAILDKSFNIIKQKPNYHTHIRRAPNISLAGFNGEFKKLNNAYETINSLEEFLAFQRTMKPEIQHISQLYV